MTTDRLTTQELTQRRLAMLEILTMHKYAVQVGKGRKGAYKTRYNVATLSQAMLLYRGINIGNGYKKRLVDTETGLTLAKFGWQ